MRVTLNEVRHNPEVEAYIKKGDELLAAIGYTEHSFRHVSLVSKIAQNIMQRLGFPERDQEVAAIAGYLHDIGNVTGRYSHPQTGALLAERILRSMGMDPLEVAPIIGAIGNHEEDSGEVVSSISAALILADKTDVHRSRVRNLDFATFDIHDRVNYASEHSFLRVEKEKRTITLELTINTEISPVMDYFEIFLTRMIMCRRAASFLGCNFELSINNVRLL
ncbi:MAG: HD domain-containing protein [Bacillota bacterium]